MADAHPIRAVDDHQPDPSPDDIPAPRRAVAEREAESDFLEPSESATSPTAVEDTAAAAQGTVEEAPAESADDPETELTPQALESNQGRPSRPPILETQAAVVEKTRPGRVQVASERFWTGAIVFGIVGALTALVTHGHAVDELTAQANTNDPEEIRRSAANILHFTMIGVVLAGLIPEAILATFLGNRRIVIRVLLSVLAVGAVLVLPLASDILGPSGWRGTVIQICLSAHALGAFIATVLMWMPKGRLVKPKK